MKTAHNSKSRLFISGIIIILLILVFFFSYHRVSALTVNSALQTHSLTLSNVSLSLERELALNRICIDNFLSDHAVQQIIGNPLPCSPETLMEAVQTLKKTTEECSLFSGAVFASCSADTVLSVGRDYEDFSFSNQIWNEFSLLSSGIHRTETDNVIYVVRYPENRPVACIVLTFDREQLDSVLFSIQDKHSFFLYSNEKEPLVSKLPFPERFPRLTAYNNSANIYSSMENNDQLYITATDTQYKWILIMPVSVSSLLPKPIAVLRIFYPYMLALFAVYCVYFVIHTARAKIRHVNEEKEIYGLLLQDALPQVETSLFSEMLSKKERSPEDVADSLHMIKSNFSEGAAIPVLIDWLLPDSSFSISTNKLEINAQKAGIRAMLPDLLEGTFLVPNVGEKRLAIIWKPDTSNQARILSAENRLKETVEKYMQERNGKVLILFGEPGELVEGLYDSYRSAHRIMGHEKYFVSAEPDAENDAEKPEGTRIFQLAKGILSGDETCISDALQHYRSCSVPANLEFLHELFNMIVDTLLRLQAREDEPFFKMRETFFSENVTDGAEKRNADLSALFAEAAELYARLNKREQHIHVENAREMIAREYNNPDLSLGQVSSALGISPSYFSTIFPIYTGMGFVEYLNDFRIKKAKQLLENSDFTIQEIGFRTGFNSPQSFHRVFKKYYGETPGQYRMRKNQERSNA